jgi:outer membrane protein assembly factor BamB
MKSQKALRNNIQVLLFVFCVCAALAIFSNIAKSADWPNYRGPSHNGITNETNWSANWSKSGPKQLWKKSIGIGFSSITVSNGRVYTMGNTGRKGDKKEHDIVFCLDANTGREIWTHIYPCPLQPKSYEGGTLSTPTVDGNVVYTISKMGHLFCLKAATGEVVWQKNMNRSISAQQASPSTRQTER